MKTRVRRVSKARVHSTLARGESMARECGTEHWSASSTSLSSTQRAGQSRSSGGGSGAPPSLNLQGQPCSPTRSHAAVRQTSGTTRCAAGCTRWVPGGGPGRGGSRRCTGRRSWGGARAPGRRRQCRRRARPPLAASRSGQGRYAYMCVDSSLDMSGMPVRFRTSQQEPWVAGVSRKG